MKTTAHYQRTVPFTSRVALPLLAAGSTRPARGLRRDRRAQPLHRQRHRGQRLPRRKHARRQPSQFEPPRYAFLDQRLHRKIPGGSRHQSNRGFCRLHRGLDPRRPRYQRGAQRQRCHQRSEPRARHRHPRHRRLARNRLIQEHHPERRVSYRPLRRKPRPQRHSLWHQLGGRSHQPKLPSRDDPP